MGFLLGLAQCGFPTDGDVLSQVKAYAARAASEQVSLVAFPEGLVCPRGASREELERLAEPLDGPFVSSVARTAKRYGLWIVFTMSEVNPAGGPPFNTAVVVDDRGCVRCSYQKCHLYDAHGVRESDRMSRGNTLCEPVDTSFASLACSICYDLRFPEAVRTAAASCDLLLYLAAWYDGPHKPDHWQTLLRARAIENECYVAGVCWVGESLVEHSMVVDPLGEVVAEAKAGETLLIATIDPEAVATARDAMPVFVHRRPELYRGTFASNESFRPISGVSISTGI